MGALTLKSFPFELRGWDIEKFESLDPTDGFASNTKVYVNQNQIIQIEPSYDNSNRNSWLSDKGRNFFDGIFKTLPYKNSQHSQANLSWLKSINRVVYIFDHCLKQNNRNYFFTIIFNNLSLEILNLLLSMAQSYSFIKLRRPDSLSFNTNLEHNFQLNSLTKTLKNNQQSLCLLLSTNPRYEGYQLNLNLRKKALNYNFKCLIIGSIINLTFPTTFLGSNSNIFKTILEGNNFICQHIKHTRKTFLVYNNKILNWNNAKNLTEIIQSFNTLNTFNGIWNTLNILNSGLSDTGIFASKLFPKITSTDFDKSNTIYSINTTSIVDISNLQKIIELKSLKSLLIDNYFVSLHKCFIHQTYQKNNLLDFYRKMAPQQIYLVGSNFFTTKGTFVNTLGFTKRTVNLISTERNDWQILRKLLRQFKTKLNFLNAHVNQNICFNMKKFFSFRYFIELNYHPTVSLHYYNVNLKYKNNPILLNFLSSNFKVRIKKLFYTKLKFWLNDLYNESVDEYSQHSATLNNCSKILRLESTNFF